MRFLSIWTPSRKTAETPPSKDHMEKMGKFVEESFKSGELLDTGAILPLSQGARLVSAGGEVTLTDGPYAESKECIAGFAMLQAKSKEEAIAMARRFIAVAGEGECEIRQVMEPQDTPAGA